MRKPGVLYVPAENLYISTEDRNAVGGTLTWGYPITHDLRAYLTYKAERVKVATKQTATGYIVEVAVPWDLFPSFKPASGARIGFDVLLRDDDDRHGHDSWLRWNGQSSSPSNASLLGTLILK